MLPITSVMAPQSNIAPPSAAGKCKPTERPITNGGRKEEKERKHKRGVRNISHNYGHFEKIKSISYNHKIYFYKAIEFEINYFNIHVHAQYYHKSITYLYNNRCITQCIHYYNGYKSILYVCSNHA